MLRAHSGEAMRVRLPLFSFSLITSIAWPGSSPFCSLPFSSAPSIRAGSSIGVSSMARCARSAAVSRRTTAHHVKWPGSRCAANAVTSWFGRPRPTRPAGLIRSLSGCRCRLWPRSRLGCREPLFGPTRRSHLGCGEGRPAPADLCSSRSARFSSEHSCDEAGNWRMGFCAPLGCLRAAQAPLHAQRRLLMSPLCLELLFSAAGLPRARR